MSILRSSTDTTTAQAHGSSQPLPRRIPGAHRRDELGESSAFVFDEHENWSPETLQAVGRFLARREAP